jgi:alpha-galactosidase
MIPLIESLAFDIPRVIITNVLNDGEYVQGLPRDFEVEIPALVSGNGIQGIACRPLPKPVIAHILRDRVAPVEVELDAYEQGDYEMLLSLILMDPWTTTEKQARSLLDAVLDQPELAEMKNHYKRRPPTIL